MHSWDAVLVVLAMLEVVSAQNLSLIGKAMLAMSTNIAVVAAFLGDHLPQTMPNSPCASTP